MLPWKKLAKRQRNLVFDALAEVDRMVETMSRMLETARHNPGLVLASLVLEAANDGQEVGNRASECMGWAFANYLGNHPEAPNYLEVTLEASNTTLIYVTVQRPGGMTPHQLRMKAEKERDHAERELEALKISIGISECDNVFCEDPGCPKNNPRT